MKTLDQNDSVKQQENSPNIQTLIYHIADGNQWEQAQSSLYYVHPSLHTDGFIHCSKRDQMVETANLYFGEEDQILVLFIDPSKLEPELVYEEGPRGEFPHIYGPINISCVERTKLIKRKGKKFNFTLA